MNSDLAGKRKRNGNGDETMDTGAEPAAHESAAASAAAAAAPAADQAAAAPEHGGAVPMDDDVNPKRRRGDDAGDDEEEEDAYRRLRLLFDSRDVGAIIGKGGQTISQLRESSGADIDAGRHDPNITHRVVTIGGMPDRVVYGLSLVIAQLAQQWEAEEITLCLLMLRSHAGAVIGRAGAAINATRQETGAHVRIENETLDFSQEKLVTITGTPEAVTQAATRVATQILEQDPPARPAHLYEPRPAAPPMGHGAPGMPAPRGPPGGTYFMPPAPGYGGYVDQQGQAPPQQQQQQPQQQQADDQRHLTLPVPQEMVGALIGKGGSVINEIRQRSGASVKIGNDPEPAADGSQRIVTISGPAQATDAALAMVYERLQNSQY